MGHTHFRYCTILFPPEWHIADRRCEKNISTRAQPTAALPSPPEPMLHTQVPNLSTEQLYKNPHI
jgi:hypothetical protein